MDEKELPCRCCIHKNVCKYTKDFADIISAVEKTTVHQSEHESDGCRVRTTPIVNFAFLVTIATSCNFFKEDC